MEEKKIKSIVLISDTFLPLVDGVCNTVINYQKILTEKYGVYTPVITPKQEGFDYKKYPFPIITLKSLDTERQVGYRGAVPLSISTIKKLKRNPPQIIHVHTPFAALSYAIILRYIFKCPIVFTYHTKFDLELKNRIKNKAFYLVTHQYMIDQIKCADETWAVNDTVKRDLISNGCEVNSITMENGTDMPSKELTKEEIKKYTDKYINDDDRLVFLFIGRHFWVKGFKITLDALGKLKKKGVKFTFVSIGQGEDFDAIKKLAFKNGLNDEDVKFLGKITDKKELKAWYSYADLFLLPSTYDCCPLVVIEAAASKTPSVLIGNSDSSSHKTDKKDCFLIEENSDSLFKLLYELNNNRELIKKVGETAFKNIYVSWDQAIAKAYPRYQTVIDNCKKRKEKQHHRFFIAFVLKAAAFILNFLSFFVIIKKEH